MGNDKKEINLDKYIQGELNSVELMEFEDLLEKDEALQKKLNFHQYVDVILHKKLTLKNDDSDVDAELKPILKELGNKYFSEETSNEFNVTTEEEPKETISKPSNIKRLLRFTTLATAAALLLFLFLPNKNNKLYESFFEPEKLISLQSSNGNSSNFDKANGLYKSKNYKEAKVLYEKTLVESPNNSWALVYKGCSEMELNQIGNAISTFQQLLAQHNDFSGMANWYLALCYLKNKDEPQVKNSLERILVDDKTYYNKAQKLLEEL